jgi:hypothetical protein
LALPKTNKQTNKQKKGSYWLMPVISGGRDQEYVCWKPAWANSSGDPTSKKPTIKKGWWSGSRCRPWVQTPVPQKKRKQGSRREV